MSALLLVMAGIGTAYYILSSWALAASLRSSILNPQCAIHNRVSLLKPVCGADEQAAANFRTFLDQDYPDYEVLFGVLNETDPGLIAINTSVAGDVHASVHTGTHIDGANNKVRILANLADIAAGDIFVITDADVRVGPDFLSHIVEPFADPDVGLVSCMYRGIEPKTIADRLQVLHMSAIFAPGVGCARMFGEIDFALGAAIAIRRDALAAIGGFESIADYLADDFQLGRKTARAGRRVVISNYVVDVVLGGERLRDVLARELRWSVTTRVSRPWGHFGLITTFGSVYALAYLASTGFSIPGWSAFVSVAAVRLIGAWVGAKRMGDAAFPSCAVLLCIRDLLSFGVWVAGYFTRTVIWRGRHLRLTKDGRIKLK